MTDDRPSLSNWQAIRLVVGPFKTRMAMFGSCTVLVGLLEALFLVIVTRSGLAIADGADDVTIVRGLETSIGRAILVGAVLLLLRLGLSYLMTRIQAGLAYRITSTFRKRLGRGYLSASWAVQARQPAGTFQQLVVQFPSNISSLVFQLSNALGGFLSLAALLAIAVAVGGVSTLIVLGVLVVLGLLLTPMRRAVGRSSRRSMASQVAFADNIAEISNLSLEINALGISEQAARRLEKVIDDEAAAVHEVGLTREMISPLYTAFSYAVILLALFALHNIATDSIEEVGSVMLIMMRSLSYGQQTQQGAISISQFAPFAERLILQQREFESDTRPGGDVDISSIDTIRFRDVSFAYPDRPEVLSHADFTIRHGEVVGIVGHSGAGKTTLVQLIMGLHRAVGGEILVNDIPREQLRPSSWSRLATYVPQDSRLMAGTIEDNVRFLRENVTDSDIDQALRAAGLDLPPEAFPDGKRTDLGGEGRQFSGGQRQRLAIARALATGPSILILDEPTSSLDVESESVVVETISRLKGSVTTIVVTHRESTLRACDRVLLVEGGTVTETTSDRITPDQLENLD